MVTTPDGVDLAVREVGPEDARLTVVFAHGFCLRMGAFYFQRARLAEQWGPQVRMVFYDQRGHGQSAEASPDSYTVTQLGRDLETVLAVMAPRGPVVLVGHSMGGMTVLSHARQFPQRYPTRVVGAAIIASAAEGVSRSPLGEILKNPALEAARFAVRYAPKTVHRTRGAAKSVIAPILRAASYGDEKISPSVVAFSEKMMHDTPIATLVEFLHALEVHDETAALPTLAKVPTLIACGDRDLLTPMEHSAEHGRRVAEVRAGDRRRRRASGAARAARGHRRRPRPAGRARHTRPSWSRSRVGCANGCATMAERRSGTAELATAEDTIALGAQLGRQVRAGDVVVLSGPLGAGKTVLAKGIARGDGRRRAGDLADVRAGPRASRALRGFPADDPRRLVPAARPRRSVDLLAELDSLDLDTDLDDAVVVVEWGEGLAERLSDSHLDIRLERGPDTEVRTAIWQWSRQ